MALQSSGVITLQDIHDEAGGTTNSTAQCSVDDADIRALINRSAGGVQSFDDYYGAAAANTTSSIAGGGSTTTNQFPNCNVSLSTGNKLVVVIPMIRIQSGSSLTNGPTSVTIGGQSATQRQMSNQNVAASGYGHMNSIWTLETTLSGTQLVTGSTMSGTGNNSCIVYEITGHTQATPHSTSVASNYTGSAATSDTIGVNTVSGGTVVMGITASAPGNSSTITTSPSSTESQNSFSNLNHAAMRKDNTSAGTPTIFTISNTQSGFFNIVAASFK